MLTVLLGVLACPNCGSPLVEYRKYCRTIGITSGRLMTDECAIEDSDFCNVCFDYSKVVDAVLVYTPDRCLLEIMEDPDEKVFLIYRIPCDPYLNSVYFLVEEPELLARVDSNEFTRAVIDAIADESLSEQHRLDLLYTMIDKHKLEDAAVIRP